MVWAQDPIKTFLFYIYIFFLSLLSVVIPFSPSCRVDKIGLISRHIHILFFPHRFLILRGEKELDGWMEDATTESVVFGRCLTLYWFQFFFLKKGVWVSLCEKECQIRKSKMKSRGQWLLSLLF
jgi:hypothetical protein